MKNLKSNVITLPKVHIFFLNFNRCNEVIKSLNDFLKVNYPIERIHFTVIDNNSTDGSKMKIESIEGVKAVTINLVFDPAWDNSMMSEEAKLELGFL